jgi:3-dehydroshikimate dehydratase
MAEIFQTPFIRLFSFYIPPGQHSRHRSEVLNRMAILIEQAKGGFKLQLENEEGLYAESPEHTLDLLATLNHPQLRLTFDFSNFALLGYDTLKAWQSLAPYTSYFHIKDAIHTQKKIVLAGEGEGHIAEILGQAYERGFSGFASLEPHLEEARKDGGFSGESNFARAHRALVSLLQSISAKYN